MQHTQGRAGTHPLTPHGAARRLPRFRAADRQPVPHAPPGAVAEGTKQFQRCLQLIKAHKGFDYRAYLSGWFKDAPFEDVQRGARRAVEVVAAASIGCPAL